MKFSRLLAWFLLWVGGACLGLAQATDWPSLIQAAKPAVVWIQVETRQGTAFGSGAIVSPDGYILTAAHVVEDAIRITVIVEERWEYRASLVGVDRRADVAVLKIPASGLKWFALGDSDQVRIEEEIRVLGYPLPKLGVGMIAVAGVIQGTRVRDGVKFLQHNAPAAPGHSGGPVINSQGQVIGIQVIGILSGSVPEAPWYMLAAGVNEAKRLIPRGVLPTGPSPIRPAAGPRPAPGPTAVTGPIRVPQDQPTLAAALRAAPEGGEIRLAGGTHRGDAYVTKPVTIRGEAGAVVEGTIRVSAARAVTIANLEVHGGIEIRDTPGFTLDRVTVWGAPGDGIVIEASTGAVTGCTVEEADGAGIAASFGARVTIANTAVRRCRRSGISLTLNSQARITGCTIERNGGDGIFLAGSAAEIWGSTIRENAGWGIVVGSGASIAPSDPASANALAANARGETLGIGPARFVVSDLRVSPQPPVPMNTRVTVSATVTNVGGAGATKSVWLSLGGAKGQETRLSLNPGQSRRVEFSYPATTGEVVAICSEDACSAELAVQVYVDRAAYARRIPLPEGALRRYGVGYITGRVACSGDGKLAVTTTLGIEVWDTATWELIGFFAGWAECAAFSPDGKLLASGSGDGTIRLWDVVHRRELRALAGHMGLVHSVAFSPDGKLLASGSEDGTIRLWDVATGRELQALVGHAYGVFFVAFSPDGRLLASGSGDKTIRLWDVATGRELRALTGRMGPVYSVAFSPDGRLLASGSGDRTIRLWDVATGRELQALVGHTDGVFFVAFSPDGGLLASGSGDKTVRLWDVAVGRELRVLAWHAGPVHSLAFFPDGRLLASGSGDKTIRLWDVATGKELRALIGHTGPVYSIAFSPDGKLLASGLGDKTIKLWDLAAGRELRTLAGHVGPVYSVAFSPDGKLLASGSGDRTIKLWDVINGREPRTLAGHMDGVLSLAFSPDGRLLASGSADRTIKLWDVAAGRERRTFAGHTHRVYSVAFSLDGRLLAAGSGDGTIKLWDVATGRELRTLVGHMGPVYSVAFSPDRRLLASGSGDGTIKLWDAVTGRELRTLAGHADGVFFVAFSPDGGLLASGSVDKTIKLWEAATGRELRALAGHTDGVFSVAFSPDGKTLSSGSADGTVLLWDVAALLRGR